MVLLNKYFKNLLLIYSLRLMLELNLGYVGPNKEKGLFSLLCSSRQLGLHISRVTDDLHCRTGI